VGYLFTSTTVFILKPAPVAIVSLVFGDYVNQLLFFWLAPGELAAFLSQKIISLICIWTIICIQAISPHWLTTINTVFTIIKLAAVGSIAVIGIAILGSPSFDFLPNIPSCGKWRTYSRPELVRKNV
jgi:hypothetical protein